MGFTFNECSNCLGKSNIKKRKKQRIIGEHKGYSIIETYYTCNNCNHDNQVMVSHPIIDKAYDKAFMANWYSYINRNSDDYEKYVLKYETANKEYNKNKRLIMEEVIYGI